MRTPIRIAIAILCSIQWLGCGEAEPGIEATPPVGSTEPVMDVATRIVRRGAIFPRISVPGSLVARRESHIGARVYGPIQEIMVSEGDRVDVGDPLFQIEPETYEAVLRRAEAGLDLARAERLQIQADLDRARALQAKDIVAKQEVERLSTRLKVAEARERQAAQAAAIAQRDLDDTLVRAPFAGSVAKRLVDEGTTVTTRPQMVVVVLQETGILEARSAIAETNLAVVQVGDRALLHLESASHPIETTVSSVSDTIDPETRTYLVRMQVPNPDHEFKAGVFVHVEIEPRSKSDVILIPKDAVRSEDGKNLVFVVEDERATPVDIRLGIVSDKAAEVLEGLQPGSQIITGEAARLVGPGMRVRVRPEKGPGT
jgi:multidrug efflux system membrane fusion protein